MIPISISLMQNIKYGGSITFIDKKDMRKVLKHHGWTKPIKYSRKWFKEGFGEWDLYMAYNLELYPDRLTKIKPNPFALENKRPDFFDKDFYKEGMTISIGLGSRIK